MNRYLWSLAFLLSLALSAMVLIGFHAGAPVYQAQPRVELSGGIDFDRLFEDIAVDRVQQTHGRIVRHPTRLAGTEGDLEVSRHVEDEFRRVGLEVVVQHFPVTVPVTKRCRIRVQSPESRVQSRGTEVARRASRIERRGGSTPVADTRLATPDPGLASLSLLPFWPNHVRTCTTPPEGIVGRVIDVGMGRLEDLEGLDIEGQIALARMTPDFDWLAAANLGARAVLFRPSSRPFDYAHKILQFPGNIPRFLVQGPADQLIGNQARIEARVDWEIRTARNVIGVLKPDRPTGEALVLMGFTDSWSVVPDRAPGHYEACSATGLLEAARALAAQRTGLARTVIFVACSGQSLAVEGPRRILDAIGLRGEFDANRALVKKRLDEAVAAHEAMRAAHQASQPGDYWKLDASGERELWGRFGTNAKAVFNSVTETLIDRYVGVVERQVDAARIVWVRADQPDTGKSIERLRALNRQLQRAREAAGADGLSLKLHFPDVLDTSGCREQLDQALNQALSLADKKLRVARDADRVAELFRPFEKTYFCVLAPSTRGRRMRYEAGGLIGVEFDRARDAVVTKWLEWKGKSRVASGLATRDSGLGTHDSGLGIHDSGIGDRNSGIGDRNSGLRTPDSGLPPPHPSHFMIDAFTSSEGWVYTGRSRTMPAQKEIHNGLLYLRQAYSFAKQVSIAIAGVDLPEEFQTPLETPVSYEAVSDQIRLMTAVLAQLATGAQPMPLPVTSGWAWRWFSDLGGEVVSPGGPNSILPERPVPDALVVIKNHQGRFFHIQKTRDGTFRIPAAGAEVLIDAYTVDPLTGQLTGAHDLGPDGQRFPSYFTEAKHYEEPESRVTILLARLSPMDFFQLVGPNDQPLTPDVLNADLIAPLDHYSIVHEWEHGATVFAPPGKRVFVLLKNYPHYRYYHFEGKNTQAFLLGHGARESERKEEGREGEAPAEPGESPESVAGRTTEEGATSGVKRPESRDTNQSDRTESILDSGLRTLESSSLGYLAGNNRRAVFPVADAATSVARLNRERLDRQQEGGLADPVSLEMAGKAEVLLERGLRALRERRYADAHRDLNQSTAISMRIYPQIRIAVADAINGILLYMFLLVPFSVFAERLLIGSSDIRTRIAGTFSFLLMAFLFIRYTHPAYGLVTSPLIVLVGFVIFMLCLLILVFISGKFSQRIAELRRAGGGATETDSDVSRSAAAAAAFGLGINNMRKRKVRTAFTVATLVLVSFCLVCFTAPRPEMIERRTVLGRSPWDGAILRFERESAGVLSAVRMRYGDRARILGRRAHQAYWTLQHTPAGGSGPRTARVRGVLYMEKDETMLSRIDELILPGPDGQRGWIERNDEQVIYISDITAAELGIDPSEVGQGKIDVLLVGWLIRVAGVFDSTGLDALRDVDGETNLPELEGRFSGRARLEERTRQIAGRPGAKRITTAFVPGSQMILMPLDPAEGGLFSSFVLLFEDLPYGVMRELINDLMDASPTFINYALDGLAIFGGRFSVAGLEALVDVIVPLLIASFIVFNTMLGSVYERQKEISVYSAVGLSPRHVFYLFLAESLVYAVIGVVGGYLLALGLQWLSHHSGGLLDLSINYSSRSALVVTLTLMIAVMVSTFIPARRAARIAAPSEHLSWSLDWSSAATGRLEFHLPFTYVGRDVLAVVPFLSGWFDARGEDSAGEFSASAPQVEVNWPARHASEPVLAVAATVWLRPYDLGVSQRVRIAIEPFRAEGAANLHIAAVRLDLLSGDEHSWHRTNARFIALLRQHLLTWRALSPRRKQAMFEDCVEQLSVEGRGSV